MALREVIDDQGKAWTIYAIVPSDYDDRIGIAKGYSRGWLCFQSGTEKWRFLGIPHRWETFADMELLALMEDAVPTMKRNDNGRRV